MASTGARGADGRPGRLEGGHRRLHVGPLALARPSQALIELVLAAQQARARHAAVLEDDLGRVAGADAVLLELLTHADPGGALRDDEAGLAPSEIAKIVDRPQPAVNSELAKIRGKKAKKRGTKE